MTQSASKPDKEKPEKPKEPAKPSRLVRIGRPLYRPMTLATAALVVLAGLFLPHLLNRLPDLSQRDEYLLAATDIEITQPPHWVPHNLVAQIVENANLPARLSLLDKNLVVEIAEAFQLNPWIEEVVSVSKSYPARVVVVLNYRQPVAMVEVRQGKYPIDRHGVLLPPQDFSVADTRAYPVITGVVSTPQGPAGTEWGDKAIAGAAELAAELAPHWKKLGLASIVAPRTVVDHEKIDEGVYVLLSKGGSRIIWGHPPGTDHPGELSTKQKIGRLAEYVTKFGGFDHPQGPYQIDIRPWRDISRTPLSAGREWLDQMRE